MSNIKTGSIVPSVSLVVHTVIWTFCSINTGVGLTSPKAFQSFVAGCLESIVKFQGGALSDEWVLPMAHWLIVFEVGTDRKRHFGCQWLG